MNVSALKLYLRSSNKQAYLALALAGLKGAVQIATRHHSFIRGNAAPAGWFADTVTLFSAVAEDVAVCGSVCCDGVMQRRRAFGAFHKCNVDGGVGGGGGAAVKQRSILKGPSVLIVEIFHPWGVWREEELPERIGQSRAGLNLTQLCSSGWKVVLA